ncbi:hypothetical protein D3C76_1631770 [compost metagenome]
MFAEARLEFAQGAAHLAGQGGFQLGGEQHADQLRVFARSFLLGMYGDTGQGQQQRQVTVFNDGQRHPRLLPEKLLEAQRKRFEFSY